VSEGAALGLVVLGRVELPNERWRLDLAFESAWSDWSFRHRYPQVDTDLRQGLNGSIALTRAQERQHTLILFWNPGRTFTIYRRQDDWHHDDPQDVAYAVRMIDGDVPLNGWRDLAQSLLDHFDR